MWGRHLACPEYTRDGQDAHPTKRPNLSSTLCNAETSKAISAQEDLTEKDALAQTRSLLPQELLPSIASESKQIATTVLDTFDRTTQTPTSTENQVAISWGGFLKLVDQFEPKFFGICKRTTIFFHFYPLNA